MSGLDDYRQLRIIAYLRLGGLDDYRQLIAGLRLAGAKRLEIALIGVCLREWEFRKQDEMINLANVLVQNCGLPMPVMLQNANMKVSELALKGITRGTHAKTVTAFKRFMLAVHVNDMVQTGEKRSLTHAFQSQAVKDMGWKPSTARKYYYSLDDHQRANLTRIFSDTGWTEDDRILAIIGSIRKD